MFFRQTPKVQSILLLGILMLMILVGCAAKKSFWGDPDTGLILQYRMEKDEVVSYNLSEVITQTMDMMGQSMEVVSNKDFLFSMQSKKAGDNKYYLNVTMDSMSVNVESPQGEMAGDVSEAIGKSFTMSVSSMGQEGNFEGIELIQYSLGPQGKRGIRSDFEAFFTNVPGEPLKVGDTWPSQDTLHINEQGMEMVLSFNYENKLTGLETVHGFECAKITSEYTGSVEGGGNQQGMDMTFEGDSEGTTTWFFAYKEGMFIQQTTEGFTEATIAITGAQNMTIPMTMDVKVDIKYLQ
jgi:hypothetical protein